MPIHPTAHIHPSAEIEPSTEIGPNVIVEEDVVIGADNLIMANAFIGPRTRIGEENRIHMGAVVGHEPQDYAFEGETSHTRIGDRNEIREYATIHRGTGEGTTTLIGDDCFIMTTAHVAHNCVLGNGVTMANGSILAGHVQIEDRAFLSGHTALHQFTRVGTRAMLSGLSTINKDLPPFMMAHGQPAKVIGLNVLGLRRSGIAPAARKLIKEAYKTIYRSGLILPEALERLDDVESPEVRHLVGFIRESKRGIMNGAEGGARNGDE